MFHTQHPIWCQTLEKNYTVLEMTCLLGLNKGELLKRSSKTTNFSIFWREMTYFENGLFIRIELNGID